MDYQVEKIQMQTEFAKQMAEVAEEEQKEEGKQAALTVEKALELKERTNAMMRSLFQGMAQVDPASGKQVLQMDDPRLELLLQREKDKMKVETGYSNEQITKFLQANQE